jgi:hypothetical protein
MGLRIVGATGCSTTSGLNVTNVLEGTLREETAGATRNGLLHLRPVASFCWQKAILAMMQETRPLAYESLGSVQHGRVGPSVQPLVVETGPSVDGIWILSLPRRYPLVKT